MILQILLLLLGLTLIITGADRLIDAASEIARRAHLSEFVIGLTIVGIGTSAPEAVVSFIGAIRGNPEIAVGNIVGSNIINTLLGLGLAAIIAPVAVTAGNMRKDIPLNLAVVLIVMALGFSATLFHIGSADTLSRFDGGIMLLLFITYIIWSLLDNRDKGHAAESKYSLWAAIALAIAGLAALVFGGELFVNSAGNIARALGISDKFVAVTILAGGTSLPEIATSITATIKKKGQLALGNILGSNVFNILLILGGSALINPLSMQSLDIIDILALILSALALIVFSLRPSQYRRIGRFDGIILLAIWLGYFVWLCLKL